MIPKPPFSKLIFGHSAASTTIGADFATKRIRLKLFSGTLIWAVIWGGAKRMGGGKRTRERTLPEFFGPLQKWFWSALSWIFIQEKQSTDT